MLAILLTNRIVASQTFAVHMEDITDALPGLDLESKV